MTQRCIAIYVSGIVQGVGFRYYTQRKASSLGLTGTVCNLEDGRVEILACGETEQLNDLLEWIKTGGSPAAKVEQVLYEPRPPAFYPDFRITH